MSESKVFRGGVPYNVDVNRLKEAFPVESLTEGRVITHSDLSGAIDTPPQEHRYYGVVNSWIRQMKNQNGVYIVWEPTQGVKVLDPAGILAHGESRTRQKAGQLGRAVKIFGWVPRHRLDQTGQQRLDHQMRVAGALQKAVVDAKKELAVDFAPVKSLPKPRSIREAS